MINPKELRIGNFVEFGIIEKIFIPVSTIGGSGINGKYEADADMLSEGVDYIPYLEEYKFEDINPIPLSRELLFLCGFELQKGLLAHRYFKKDDLELERSAEGFKRIMVTQFCTFRFELEYKFFHEIQNLYFSLTGKELEVPL
jgi:hypothetical protein